MDINGAKALKKRLDEVGADEAPPVADPADVPADAPPVYHWTGKMPPQKAMPVREEGDTDRSASLFSRLVVSFR
jgi:hypothetical protein